MAGLTPPREMLFGALLMSALMLTSSTSAGEAKEKLKGFWQDRKKTSKKVVKKVKEGGKVVGKEVQEIFDPEDEDLQPKRKPKK